MKAGNCRARRHATVRHVPRVLENRRHSQFITGLVPERSSVQCLRAEADITSPTNFTESVEKTHDRLSPFNTRVRS
jgi:hypothetical protein